MTWKTFLISWGLLIGCKTVHTAEVQQRRTVDTARQADVERTKETGPSVDLRFAPVPAGRPAANAAKPDGLPLHGELLAATFHSGSLEQLRDLSRRQQQLNEATQTKKRDEMTPAASCAFGGYLWALAVIGVVFAVWRFLRR